MKMILVFALVSIALGFKVKRVDRWVVIVLALCMLANILVARLSF